MRNPCEEAPRAASWFNRLRFGFWPEAFLAGSAVLGVETVIAGRFLRSLEHIAWLSPGAFAVLCCICLGHLPLKRQMRWVALGAGITTGVLTSYVIWVSPLALAFLPAPGWFPWLVLWGGLPGICLRVLSSTSPFTSGLSTIAVLSMAYVVSGAICFLPWECALPPDVEHSDELGRKPALGPGISWVGNVVCVPAGPSSIVSRDYAGTEWIWTVYQPLVRLWFLSQSTAYYYPYATMPPRW